MGHYDDCYENRYKIQREADKEQAINSINNFVKTCKETNKLEMIVDIINNIEDWRGVYNLLNKEK